jgi:hypothetical protein
MASAPQRTVEPEKTELPIAEPPAPTTVSVPKEFPSASISAPLSAQEIYRLIQETAYFKAEARQFAPGVELQDWLDAEKEVRQRLQAP